MSTTKRLISGSVASWLTIFVTILTQFALVPIYLSHWKSDVYATWLALQALIVVFSTFDVGHQEFIGYECFKFIGDKRGLSKLLCSAGLIGLILGSLQIILIFIFFICNILPFFLELKGSHSPTLLNDAGIVLIALGVSWLVNSSVGGLISRSLSGLGYFPRTQWWQVVYNIILSAAPAVTVLLGGGLVITGLTMAVSVIAFNIPWYYDMLRILRKEGVPYSSPSIKLGLKNFFSSLALSAKGLLENARRQGARLFLNPLAGSLGLIAFSTMRTGANVALQGLSTVTQPLLPELMRFLSQRDQQKSETAFATVWIIVVAILAPAVVIFQVVIQPVFLIWTRGKVEFDPLLFALFSQSILVYAVAQPAMAIMEGNNLLKPQLLLSALSAAIVVGGMFVLVPLMGIRGAGLSLLIAEIGATIGYRIVARRWLRDIELKWPRKMSATATLSVWLSAAAMGAMVVFPAWKYLILPAAIIILYWNCRRFWKILPAIATERFESKYFKSFWARPAK